MAKKILLFAMSILLIYSLTACSLLDKFKNKEQTISESDLTKENGTESDEQENTKTPVVTSLESPAKIGEWIETLRYSSIDGAYHKAYFRIKDILRNNDEVKEILEEYNSAEHNTYFKDIEDKDIEYCIIKYELYFPEDFPTESFGIGSVNIDFSVTTSDGDDIQVEEKKYTNLNCVFDITTAPELDKINAGQTFKDGMAVFSMVKDYDDYILKSYYFNGGQLIYSFVKGK